MTLIGQTDDKAVTHGDVAKVQRRAWCCQSKSNSCLTGTSLAGRRPVRRPPVRDDGEAHRGAPCGHRRTDVRGGPDHLVTRRGAVRARRRHGGRSECLRRAIGREQDASPVLAPTPRGSGTDDHDNSVGPAMSDASVRPAGAADLPAIRSIVENAYQGAVKATRPYEPRAPLSYPCSRCGAKQEHVRV